MDISFVIPAYNEELRIGKCLESVQAEIARYSYDTEIIVVNNASTDRTAEIAGSFPSVRVVTEDRKGLTRARQAGFVASSGTLVANIDSDTMVPEGWLKTVIDAFKQDEKLVVLSGPYIYYDAPLMYSIWIQCFYAFTYIAYLCTRFVLRIGSVVQGGNFVVRRSALEAIGGFDTSIAFYGEDTDIARRLHKVGKVRWTYSLPMYTTARRLAHEGLVTTGWRYALNFVWTTLTGKPYTETYADIRTN
ncbi:MAG: glycosyl transferase family 2 [Candidatus Kaiserbacteria bacterium]|nr:glycosyl transferase family 2 [Candidatus Kaiserbacteria bacterium]